MTRKEKRLKRPVFGLLPVVGRPEVVFSPIDGIRVVADDHETWVRYLDEIPMEDGRDLANGLPLTAVVRLQRVSPGHPGSGRPVRGTLDTPAAHPAPIG